MGKNLSSKYGQKLLDSAAKKKTTDAIKTASKRVIQKTTEATGDLIGSEIADKITNTFNELQNNEANDESEASKKKYISPQKRQQIIDELRLV